jgi:hypothetical protein
VRHSQQKNVKGIFIMRKSLLKIAITTALTVAFAVPAFANAFSDVPARHWAYGAVDQLAKDGVIDGMNDGTFRGDKTMTRYEMAQIVAKAMNKSDSMNANDKATLDKLEREFSSELNTLGIKVADLQNQIDNQPKISGDARVRFFGQKATNENGGSKTNTTDFRARVGVDGRINDDVSYSARITSGDMNINGAPISDSSSSNSNAKAGLDTANVTYKALTAGRQDLNLGAGYLFDNPLNAVSINSNGFKLVAGNRYNEDYLTDADGTVHYNNSNNPNPLGTNKIFAGEYGTTIGNGGTIAADYYKNTTREQRIVGVNASLPLGSAISANAAYYKSNLNDDSAVSYGLALPQVGLSATYRNVGQGAYTGFGALSNDGGANFGDTLGNTGFKGMEYAYDQGIAKNVTLDVKYQDFKSKETGESLGGRTTAGVNVKF